jgi:hypothetical protein
MANRISEDKTKIIYSEWDDVRADLVRVREELAEKERVEFISEAEHLRRLTLAEVNKFRRRRGERPLDLDPSSGKFARHDIAPSLKRRRRKAA